MSGWDFPSNRPKEPRVCKVCGKKFDPQSRSQLYCGAECRQKARREREGR
jgi:hypothetical protein